MTNVEKIDYMIQSLQIAKEEISYAQRWAEKYKIDTEHCWTERIPNGTIIRESLKMVGHEFPLLNKVGMKVYDYKENPMYIWRI